MRVYITPHRRGDGGMICMPLVSSLPDADQRHPDWRQVVCPECGTACWETELARESIRQEPGLRAACTRCALRLGL